MRRKFDPFSLSFLDLLAAALSAVIFLFIIVPKGEQKAKDLRTIRLSLDTSAQYLYHELDADEMAALKVGDTLLMVVHDQKELDRIMAEEAWRDYDTYSDESDLNEVPATDRKVPVAGEQEKPAPPVQQVRYNATGYHGDPPSVPCLLSVEIKWEDRNDNLDLFVCKDGKCVFGGKRNVRSIGTWDSGKSRTKLFGADLTTNQEAVRQFDEIIPGEYEVYVTFKESADQKDAAWVDGLVYSNPPGGSIQGETFRLKIPRDGAQRTRIGDVTVREDGSFIFKRSKIQ